MIPEWMRAADDFSPPSGSGAFAARTLRSVGRTAGKLRFRQGRENRISVPAQVKLVLLVLFILFLSLCRGTLPMLGFSAAALVCVCLMRAEDIAGALKTALFAALLTAALFLPAVLVRPEGLRNALTVVWKVALSALVLGVFSRTTQWNRVTFGLRSLRVPGVFIFILDMTLIYIVLLGRTVSDVLTAYILRAVGKDRRRYRSVGGVMGVTFIKGAELGRETYDAMRCRGFTDDYRGL